MTTCPVNQQKRYLLIAAITVLVAGIVLTSLYLYSAAEVRTLVTQKAYTNPEQAMLAHIAGSYIGVSDVKILHADKEIFEHLWFVEARVRAASRVDGYAFSESDSDNPGCYFIRVRDGWTLVPEGRFPEIVAFGMWLYDLPGE